MDKKKLILICSLAAVLIIVIILVFALRGCGKKDKDTNASDTTGTAATTLATDSDGNTILPPSDPSDSSPAATSGDVTEPGTPSNSDETTPGQTDPAATSGSGSTEANPDNTLPIQKEDGEGEIVIIPDNTKNNDPKTTPKAGNTDPSKSSEKQQSEKQPSDPETKNTDSTGPIELPFVPIN